MHAIAFSVNIFIQTCKTSPALDRMIRAGLFFCDLQRRLAIIAAVTGIENLPMLISYLGINTDDTAEAMEAFTL